MEGGGGGGGAKLDYFGRSFLSILWSFLKVKVLFTGAVAFLFHIRDV